MVAESSEDARRAKAAIAANFGAMALRYSQWILDRPLTQGLFEAFVALLEPEMSGRAGATVLDVASASGEPACTLARVLPQATIYATDLAPEFVALGRQRAARLGLTNVVCQQADAEALAGFGDASCNAVTCCMGLMFVPDVGAALREFWRVLKPGGLLAVSVYQKPEATPFFFFLDDLAAEIAGEAPAQQEAPQPAAQTDDAALLYSNYNACRFGDPAPLLEAAAAAGLEAVECRPLRLAYFFEGPEERWWHYLLTWPDGTKLREAVEKAAAAAGPGADAAAEARRLTARRLQERGWLRAEDGAIYAPDQWAWMVTARRPRAAA